MNVMAGVGLSVELFCTPSSGCNMARDSSFVIRIDELTDNSVKVTMTTLDGEDEGSVVYPASEAGVMFLRDVIERAACKPGAER